MIVQSGWQALGAAFAEKGRCIKVTRVEVVGSISTNLSAHHEVVLGIEHNENLVQHVHPPLVHLATALEVVLKEAQIFIQQTCVLDDLYMVSHVTIQHVVFFGVVQPPQSF